jgi:hypothetical protein
VTLIVPSRRERRLTSGIRLLLTITAYALTTPVPAQAPAPTTTAFDGKYVGSATETGGGRALETCAIIVSEEMIITRGEVIIHEILTQNGQPIFRGSINAAGEVSASHSFKGTGLTPGTRFEIISGTVHDNVFEGQRRWGYWCYDTLRMQKVAALGPATPFDGDYIGVSRELANGGAGCPPSGVPGGTLIIRNSVAFGQWQGTVSPQGIVSLRTPNGTPVDGQIDGQGMIRVQGTSAAGCTNIWVWRKQTG